MEKLEKFSPCYYTFQRLSTSSCFIIYRITLLFPYALVRFNLRQIQFTHSSDRSRVRKHETQSYRESCVFHFSHFELYIYLYMYVCVYIYIYIYIYIYVYVTIKVLSLCKFIKYINDSTKIVNNKIP